MKFDLILELKGIDTDQMAALEDLMKFLCVEFHVVHSKGVE